MERQRRADRRADRRAQQQQQQQQQLAVAQNNVETEGLDPEGIEAFGPLSLVGNAIFDGATSLGARLAKAGNMLALAIDDTELDTVTMASMVLSMLLAAANIIPGRQTLKGLHGPHPVMGPLYIPEGAGLGLSMGVASVGFGVLYERMGVHTVRDLRARVSEIVIDPTRRMLLPYEQLKARFRMGGNATWRMFANLLKSANRSQQSARETLGHALDVVSTVVAQKAHDTLMPVTARTDSIKTAIGKIAASKESVRDKVASLNAIDAQYGEPTTTEGYLLRGMTAAVAVVGAAGLAYQYGPAVAAPDMTGMYEYLTTLLTDAVYGRPPPPGEPQTDAYDTDYDTSPLKPSLFDEPAEAFAHWLRGDKPRLKGFPGEVGRLKGFPGEVGDTSPLKPSLVDEPPQTDAYDTAYDTSPLKPSWYDDPAGWLLRG